MEILSMRSLNYFVEYISCTQNDIRLEKLIIQNSYKRDKPNFTNRNKNSFSELFL